MASAPLPGSATLTRDAGGAGRLVIAGDWTLAHYAGLQKRANELTGAIGADIPLDLDQLGAMDTSGAYVIAELLGSARTQQLAQDETLPPARRALLKTVADAIDTYCRGTRKKRD